MKKRLNHDLADCFDFMMNHGNPLITKITVQTSISKNFKELAI